MAGRRTPAQNFFLGVIVLFLTFVSVVVVYRSFVRRSVLQGFSTQTVSAPDSSNTSEVKLESFHRVEVKDGKPAWEIDAKEATYYPERKLTLVNDSTLTIYGAGNSTIRIRSKLATLHVEGSELKRADLEGNVVVNMDDSLFTESDVASYDSVRDEITTPGAARINGTGFRVTGEGLRMVVRERQISMERNVETYFEQWAQAPESLELPEG